ncbi:dipeptide ABC transporter ATP-binding protein [Actinomadura scrupuli]|uniref:dipeptide ABC transporter ATP-binding protein n=1 Tax=Actinomadura scrupuli TaxID=559629 RepID=UPI003D979349
MSAPPAGPARAPVLEVDDLRVVFRPGRSVVRGVSLSLAPGEVLGIVGESGSGKSVTALAMMGLLPPTATATGSVRLRGRELLGRSDRELAQVRGRELAMVFQDPQSAFTPVYPIGDQIAEAVRIHTGAGRQAARRRAVELLDLVGIPDPAVRARAFPHEFSGGMRQRALIAMAIANDPAVLIADEPTTALDVTIQAQVLEVLRVAKEATGAAVVLVTHDLGVVAGLADRVLVMYAGRVVETGAVGDVYYRPRMPYTIGLLGCTPRLDGDPAALVPIEGGPPSAPEPPPGCAFEPRCPVSTPRCSAAEPALAPAGAPGHLAACVEELGDPGRIFPVPRVPVDGPRPPRAERAAVLEVTDLARHFPLRRGTVFRRRAGTVRAVDGIGFDIREGETLGLVGESGCGKTTTLHEILRLAAPQRGRITVLGRDVTGLRRAERKELRRDLQVVFQDPLAALDPRMPVADILAEPLRAHGWRAPAVAARVEELLTLVRLEPSHADRYPAAFSGGQRQRIGIARALALGPRLIVLDEPVSALDVSVQAGVINLLRELKGRLNLSYLFVAHDLAVVRHIADRVAVMYRGRIAELGEADQVLRSPAHPYTRALVAAVPVPDPDRERARTRVLLRGEPPGAADGASPGCRFRSRCPLYTELDLERRHRCAREEPGLRPLAGDQRVACHHIEERS